MDLINSLSSKSTAAISGFTSLFLTQSNSASASEGTHPTAAWSRTSVMYSYKSFCENEPAKTVDDITETSLNRPITNDDAVRSSFEVKIEVTKPTSKNFLTELRLWSEILAKIGIVSECWYGGGRTLTVALTVATFANFVTTSLLLPDAFLFRIICLPQLPLAIAFETFTDAIFNGLTSALFETSFWKFNDLFFKTNFLVKNRWSRKQIF